MDLASLHLDVLAASWYQWMQLSHQLGTWDDFKTAVLVRFGPNVYDDPRWALSKLVKTNSVLEYQMKFEILSTKVIGLPPDFLQS